MVPYHFLRNSSFPPPSKERVGGREKETHKRKENDTHTRRRTNTQPYSATTIHASCPHFHCSLSPRSHTCHDLFCGFFPGSDRTCHPGSLMTSSPGPLLLNASFTILHQNQITPVYLCLRPLTPLPAYAIFFQGWHSTTASDMRWAHTDIAS